MTYRTERYTSVRNSLAQILDFFLDCYSQWMNECFFEKKNLDSTKIEEAGVAFAHTKYAQKLKFFER